MIRTLIRRVNPATFVTPVGYDAALLADRRPGGWARADIMVPVAGPFGVVFGGGDTLIWDGDSPSPWPARNSIVHVTSAGEVWWLQSEGHTTIPADPGRWFWPTGGWAAGVDKVTILGHLMETGNPWLEVGMATVTIDRLRTAPRLGPVREVPFPVAPGVTWAGAPVKVGRYAYVAGFDNATWQHFLTRLDVVSSTVDTPVPVTVETGPLGPLNLLHVNGVWLATAHILASAPELGFDGTPQIAAWTAHDVAGPYLRCSDIYADTIRPGWSSYAGQACRLPGVRGLCALWSRNAGWDTVRDDVDGYGPQFARATDG